MRRHSASVMPAPALDIHQFLIDRRRRWRRPREERAFASAGFYETVPLAATRRAVLVSHRDSTNRSGHWVNDQAPSTCMSDSD
jgi:hypothetical protein